MIIKTRKVDPRAEGGARIFIKESDRDVYSLYKSLTDKSMAAHQTHLFCLFLNLTFHKINSFIVFSYNVVLIQSAFFDDFEYRLNPSPSHLDVRVKYCRYKILSTPPP